MPCALPKPCVPKVEKMLGVLTAVRVDMDRSLRELCPEPPGSGSAGSAWSRTGCRF